MSYVYIYVQMRETVKLYIILFEGIPKYLVQCGMNYFSSDDGFYHFS